MRSIKVTLCLVITLTVLMETGYAAFWSLQKSNSPEPETRQRLDKDKPWGRRFNNSFLQEGVDVAIAMQSLGNLTLASIIKLSYEGSDLLISLNKGQLPAPNPRTLRALRKINHQHFSKMRKIIIDLTNSTLWNIEELVDLFFDGWGALNTNNKKARGSRVEKKPRKWQDIINDALNSFITGLSQPTSTMVK
ncbi:unnamed protein product [Allacma fusca]|uniref:Uncharacterized protein n=1 Tax=Allacma fusca TaxID=39272 RepID=A0A8J2J9W4_9HEXA|nr:unnamed protein product [Allacma fusca]